MLSEAKPEHSPLSPQGQILSSIASGVSHSAAQVLALSVWCVVQEFMKPATYSQEARVVFQQIQDFYLCELQRSPPKEWQLVDNRPQYVLKNDDWTRYISEEIRKHDTLGYLHVYIEKFIVLAASYLTERRLANHGFQGDYIEQFFSENISWGLNELSHYDPTPAALENLAARMRYLHAVRTAKGVFKCEANSLISWTWQPKFTHVQTLDEMYLVLQQCQQYIYYVKELEGARESLWRIKIRFEMTFIKCFDTLFKMRSHYFTRPLDMRFWLADTESDIFQINQQYQNIFLTHTGCILRDCLRQCDISIFNAFQVEGLVNASAVYEYFSGQRNLQALNLLPGVPIWCQVSQAVIDEYLQHYLAVCRQLLILSEAYRFVILAHLLAGDAGDLWAFGTEDGRVALHTVVQIILYQAHQLTQALDALYLLSESYRKIYFKNKQDNQDEANSIWRVSNGSHSDYHRYSKLLLQELDILQQRVSRLPQKNIQKVLQLRHELYAGLVKFIEANRQDLLPLVQPLRTDNDNHHSLFTNILRSSKIQLSSLKSADSSQQDKVKCNALLEPLLLLDNNKLFISPDFWQSTGITVTESWNIGDSYALWVQTFVLRQAYLINHYHSKCQEVVSILEAGEALSPRYSINQKSQLLQATDEAKQLLQKLLTQLISESPKWRLQWWFWPIKTLGWPFHQQAYQFSQTLTVKIERCLAHIAVLANECLKPVAAITVGCSEMVADARAQSYVQISKSINLEHLFEMDNDFSEQDDEALPVVTDSVDTTKPMPDRVEPTHDRLQPTSMADLLVNSVLTCLRHAIPPGTPYVLPLNQKILNALMTFAISDEDNVMLHSLNDITTDTEGKAYFSILLACIDVDLSVSHKQQLIADYLAQSHPNKPFVISLRESISNRLI